jgi:hypothetical protein
MNADGRDGRQIRIWAMNPMPSEGAPAQGEAGGGGEAGEVAGSGNHTAAEVQDGAAAEAVDVTAVAGALQSVGRARAGAEAAMHAAAAPTSAGAVHGGLATATARAGAGAAAGRSQEVARGIAVAEPTARLPGGGMELRDG